MRTMAEGPSCATLTANLEVLQAPCPVRGPIPRNSHGVSHIRCALQAHDERNLTAVWVFKPKQRSFRVYRQFDVISSAMTNRRDVFVMVPPAGGYEAAVYSTEVVPCKKVKFDAAILAQPADELEPPQPGTPPKENTVKVAMGVQTVPCLKGDSTHCPKILC